MLILQKTCQKLWVSSLAPRTSLGFSFFPEKFLFCTDTTGSIGWPSPAPRQRIDDCFEIHILRSELCDLLLSSHRFFRSRHGCTSALAARIPCFFGSRANLAIFVLREVSINTVLTTRARYHFTRGSEADSREELAGAPL